MGLVFGVIKKEVLSNLSSPFRKKSVNFCLQMCWTFVHTRIDIRNVTLLLWCMGAKRTCTRATSKSIRGCKWEAISANRSTFPKLSVKLHFFLIYARIPIFPLASSTQPVGASRVETSMSRDKTGLKRARQPAGCSG